MVELLLTQGHLHPIIRHYTLTGRRAPMQIADVPVDVVGFASTRFWAEVGPAIESPDQLALPLRLDAGGHRAFALGRSSPYDEPEMELARLVWQLLTGLDRQASALARAIGHDPGAQVRSADCGLSPRQVAVLALSAEGLTSSAIARRLRISPRTVEKHLQRIYATLRVSDRLSAVLRARTLGLLPMIADPAENNCWGMGGGAILTSAHRKRIPRPAISG